MAETKQMPALVMTGRLEEFQLADVLQVVGLSRQYTAIEIRRLDGRVEGTIWVKAGRVIGAERNGVRGLPAFYGMFGGKPGKFVVHHLPEPTAYPPPLGPLTSMLMEASARTRVPATTPAMGIAVPLATPHAATGLRRRPSSSAPPPVVVAPRPAPRRGIAVAIASPKGGAGKTTITLNLAHSLAGQGRSIIAIDADINGDLLSILAARDQASRGAYDILDRPDAIDEVLRRTAVDRMRILPASGTALPAVATARHSFAAEWAALIERARERADIVLVDCPAGMFGTTADVLAACTHVVGVMQSDMIASRSSDMFERGLAALPEDRRPALIGVVINMFQSRSAASVEAFHQLAVGRRSPVVFETTIPRSDAFAAANLAGLPLRLAQSGDSSVAWLFDALAAEMCGRAGIAHGAQTAAPASFLR
jgi:chromosome partitioning protein